VRAWATAPEAAGRNRGFRDVADAEDQAFGADVLAARWAKVHDPGAGVPRARQYRPPEVIEGHFDEYRRRVATRRVERFRLRGIPRTVGADLHCTADQGLPRAERAHRVTRSFVHHVGRRLAAPAESRASRLSASVNRALSPARRADGVSAGAEAVAVPPGGHVDQWQGRTEDYVEAALVRALGAMPLLDSVPGMAERERLRISMLLPGFRRVSGGHHTLLQILARLEQRGHVCNVWVHDVMHMHDADGPGVLRHDLRDYFAPVAAPVYKGFDFWQGADVAIATSWQTVYPALLRDGCRARVYIVNDHEPEFYATSVERELAERTYSQGLHCIAASPWLRDLLTERYGAHAEAFQLGVEHEVYQPRPIGRREDTVIYYARHGTPRRAVPTGIAALRELYDRRPQTRIVLFGDNDPCEAPFPYEHLGVLSGVELSWLYSQATVGLCLSMTNFSLVPKEMLACGLPCVELAGVSAESIFGAGGPIELAELDPIALAVAIERLLDDPALRERRSQEGIAFVAGHTWEHATDQIETGLRGALRLREPGWGA
jgi:glycosyltransferase involved in cell wall biosynthesis